MAGLSTLHNRRLQDIAILMYKVKKNMCPTYISTLFEQPAIKYKFALMTSLYPDSSQSPLESIRSGIWAQRHGAPLSSVTSEKWILVCYQMTITALIALFAFLNFLFLIFLQDNGYICTYCIQFSRISYLLILYIVFLNFLILIFCFFLN